MDGTTSEFSGTCGPRCVTICAPGGRNKEAVGSEPVASELLDGLFEFCSGFLVEAGNADVPDSGAEEEGALDAGGLHFLGHEREMQDAAGIAAAGVEPGLAL